MAWRPARAPLPGDRECAEGRGQSTRSPAGMAIAVRRSMNLLERVSPTPRLVEIDAVDLAVSPERAWELLRHGDLARSALVRALFAIRTLPARVTASSSGRR